MSHPYLWLEVYIQVCSLNHTAYVCFKRLTGHMLLSPDERSQQTAGCYAKLVIGCKHVQYTHPVSRHGCNIGGRASKYTHHCQNNKSSLNTCRHKCFCNMWTQCGQTLTQTSVSCHSHKVHVHASHANASVGMHNRLCRPLQELFIWVIGKMQPVMATQMDTQEGSFLDMRSFSSIQCWRSRSHIEAIWKERFG